MATDEERREAARRLRECADKYIWVDVRLVADAIGSSMEENHDVDELYCGTVEDIADLIEPSCDRDALLALADECDEMRDNGCSIGSYELYRIARCIREALGVEL